MPSKYDVHVDNRKYEAYMRHVRALASEKAAIETYGPFSFETMEAEKWSRVTGRSYELWRKK